MYSTARIKPLSRTELRVKVPGSKSVTNRALICASLAEGRTILRNASFSDDSKYLVEALAKTGTKLTLNKTEKEVIVVGEASDKGPATEIFFMGNAGTSLRFILSYLALKKGLYTVDGDQRMRERPIGVLVDALNSIGAQIKYVINEGFPPILVEANGLKGGSVRIRAPESSQFISSLLMAAPYTEQGIRIDGSDLVSEGYINLTCSVMSSFGVKAGGLSVMPGKYQPADYFVESDYSLANYFLAIPSVVKGFVEVEGLNQSSAQPEKGFLDVLKRMGLKITWSGNKVRVEPGTLTGIDVDMSQMVDSVQTLAFISLFAGGPTVIRNVPNLRVKETDRIKALAVELSKLGAKVEEFSDGLGIEPPKKLKPAAVDTYNDHRMAMSAAVVALAQDGIVINNPMCVTKSFPEFFQVLSESGVNVIFE